MPRRAGDLDGGNRRGEQDERQRRPRVEPADRRLYTRPPMSSRATHLLEKDFDRQIAATHRRLVKAMDGRVAAMSVDTKERYFAVLSTLVGKLEEAEKSLRDIAHEMIAEAASTILLDRSGV